MKSFDDSATALVRAIPTACAIAFALTCTEGARAEERATPAAAAMADEQYRKGVEAYKAKRYEEARVAFEKAYETLPAVEVLRNLGAAEVRSGKAARGARHLARWLRESSKASPDEVRLVEDLLRSAENELARFRVIVNEDGAEISIDGEVIGRSPLPFGIHVDPGPRRIVARKAGRSAERTVTVVTGAEVRVDLALEPVMKSAPVTAPRESVRAESAPIDVTAGAPQDVTDDSKAIRMLGLVGGGLGVAGALTAVGATWARSNERIGTAAYERASAIALAGAIAGLVGDLTLLTSLIVLDSKQSSTGTGQVWIEPRSAGVSYGGSF